MQECSQAEDAAAYNVFRGLHDLVETLDELIEQP